MAADGLTISEAREEIERLKGRVSSMRKGADFAARKVQGLAVRAGSAYLAAKYEASARASGAQPFSALGLTPLQTLAAVGIIGGNLVGGETGDVLEQAGEGILCAAAADLARNR